MQGNTIAIINWLLLQDNTKQYEIKEYKEKRSLDSNSYLWTLINKIAQVLIKTNDIVYVEMLKDYGVSKLLPFLPTDTPLGYCKYFDFERESELNGKIAHWYKCYKGSSEYNQEEMNKLLNGVVQEAQNLGIETLEDKKIKDMVDRWGI